MVGIRNYDVYLRGMAKGYEDKLFFSEMLKDKICGILDFGCADGTMLSYLKRDFPEARLVGYDNSKEMVQLAKRRTNGYVTSIYGDALDHLDPSESLLNLSSVVHEVYSYSPAYARKEFWDDVFGRGFKYVTIRDFCLGGFGPALADTEDYQKVKAKANKKQVEEFEKNFGSLRYEMNFVHFLMKYRYVENWEREVKENYFAINLEMIEDIAQQYGYEVMFKEHYMLPFTRDRVKEDFDVNLPENTHVKFIFKKG